ncbi:MAG: DUF3810 domain-containing protein [Bacteroidetes bacterium]|nr:DUF3810 domain-containing protein [Bacteroidota bacterium]
MLKKISNRKRFFLPFFILLTLAILIKVFSYFPSKVEHYYSNGFYPPFSRFLRKITGIFPFSLGDILYTIALLTLMIWLIRGLRVFIKKKPLKPVFSSALKKMILWILGIYVWFNIAWGLNYDRLGITYKLGIEVKTYSTSELTELSQSLLEQLNKTRLQLGTAPTYPSANTMYSQVLDAYGKASKTFPFLSFQNPSMKSSLFGNLGNDLGYLGYYNPFSGEAQVNTTVPAFIIPFTVCHEAAHQLGYGSESEANLVGYITATQSGNTMFQYSAYFNLFAYANSQLYQVDSITAKANIKNLDTLVKTDYQTYRDFLIAHQNPIEPIISRYYGLFLQANKQPLGILTYDEVVGWLIAYKNKFGKI